MDARIRPNQSDSNERGLPVVIVAAAPAGEGSGETRHLLVRWPDRATVILANACLLFFKSWPVPQGNPIVKLLDGRGEVGRSWFLVRRQRLEPVLDLGDFFVAQFLF